MHVCSLVCFDRQELWVPYLQCYAEHCKNVKELHAVLEKAIAFCPKYSVLQQVSCLSEGARDTLLECLVCAYCSWSRNLYRNASRNFVISFSLRSASSCSVCVWSMILQYAVYMPLLYDCLFAWMAYFS